MSFKHVSSRRIVATIGLLAAGVALFVPLPMSASSESACEAMARWATEYERTTPAPTLDELAKFDRGRRVAIFNAVSAEVKASLFQEQLRRFSQRADLTATQRELIAEGLTLITPALYRKDPAASQVLPPLLVPRRTLLHLPRSAPPVVSTSAILPRLSAMRSPH